jgi:hypothetical protein
MVEVASAQEEKKSKYDAIPDMTKELKARIKKIKDPSKEQEDAVEEKMKKKKKDIAKLKALPKADLNAINTAIDDYAKMYVVRERIQAAREQEIRKILNDKQRKYYDDFIMNDNEDKKKKK